MSEGYMKSELIWARTGLPEEKQYQYCKYAAKAGVTLDALEQGLAKFCQYYAQWLDGEGPLPAMVECEPGLSESLAACGQSVAEALEVTRLHIQKAPTGSHKLAVAVSAFGRRGPNFVMMFNAMAADEKESV